MSTYKQKAADTPSYAELSARFDQYTREAPDNDLPTFLEALLFDCDGRERPLVEPHATRRTATNEKSVSDSKGAVTPISR